MRALAARTADAPAALAAGQGARAAHTRARIVAGVTRAPRGARRGEAFQRLHAPLAPLARGDVDACPDRPLVVGYVSPDLFTHSVSYFAEAPLALHNPARRAPGGGRARAGWAAQRAAELRRGAAAPGVSAACGRWADPRVGGRCRRSLFWSHTHTDVSSCLPAKQRGMGDSLLARRRRAAGPAGCATLCTAACPGPMPRPRACAPPWPRQAAPGMRCARAAALLPHGAAGSQALQREACCLNMDGSWRCGRVPLLLAHALPLAATESLGVRGAPLASGASDEVSQIRMSANPRRARDRAARWASWRRRSWRRACGRTAATCWWS